VGFFFSIPGILTGSLWAKFTWGTFWTFQDPKLNGVAIGVLIYLAYFILRNSVIDELKKARISKERENIKFRLYSVAQQIAFWLVISVITLTTVFKK
jgi:heme exporter protein C